MQFFVRTLSFCFQGFIKFVNTLFFVFFGALILVLGPRPELILSAKTIAPKRYFYKSAEILPERQTPERQNDDRAEKMTVIGLLSLFY